MISRYLNKQIDQIFSDEQKLALWQETELAVIRAMTVLKIIPLEVDTAIRSALLSIPIDLSWWRERDKEIHHDLNAFLDERLLHLPKSLHQYFHKDITS